MLGAADGAAAPGHRTAHPAARNRSRALSLRGWELDTRTRRLTDPDNAVVTLIKGKYPLPLAFLDAPQRPLSREHLLHAARPREDIYDRSLTFRFCGCGASWKRIPARQASSALSVVPATFSSCPWNIPDRAVLHVKHRSRLRTVPSNPAKLHRLRGNRL